MNTLKGIVVGISTTQERISLDEIKSLAETAGIIIYREFTQNLKKINPSTCIGKGKVEEIKQYIEANEIDEVLFDCELTPSQQQNLQTALETQVIDRTGIILEIFGQRAKSKDGKIQVELAQLTYKLSRLKGIGTELSRLGGGIGTRGPGESKLETDRRTIRDKITDLRHELKTIEKNRTLHRKLRDKKNIPQIAIVGYTNAGKSTLINLLTSAQTFVENKLFATLDPTTKKLKLSNGKQAVITDTVGFIEKLPHNLIEAFKSTFEEIREADLLLHIIDISNPEFYTHTRVVKEVLESMNIVGIPSLYVYNKIDIADVPKETFLRYPKERPFVMMSAIQDIGTQELLDKIEESLSSFWVKVKLKIGYVDAWLLSFLLSNGFIIKQEEKKGYSIIEVELPKDVAIKLKKSLPSKQFI
ncbi:MAG: GTPase HflX [bacterium]